MTHGKAAAKLLVRDTVLGSEATQFYLNNRGLTLAGHQVPIKASLSLPSSAENNEKLMGKGKDQEKSLTSYCHEENSFNLKKLVSFITKQTTVG